MRSGCTVRIIMVLHQYGEMSYQELRVMSKMEQGPIAPDSECTRLVLNLPMTMLYRTEGKIAGRHLPSHGWYVLLQHMVYAQYQFVLNRDNRLFPGVFAGVIRNQSELILLQ